MNNLIAFIADILISIMEAKPKITVIIFVIIVVIWVLAYTVGTSAEA